MELIDIKSFSLLEEYIREKGGIIHAFDCLFLEEVVRTFQERQLFFFVKNHAIPRDLESLKQKYQQQIAGLYDPHQIASVVLSDDNGLFWMQTSHQGKEICYPLDFSKTTFRNPLHFTGEFVPPLWMEGKNYISLYEDNDVKIIVFLLHELSCFLENKEAGTPFEKLYLVFLENGFYVDLLTPSLIRPYGSPYRYSAQLIPYSKMMETWSKEELEQARLYYEKQRLLFQNEIARKKTLSSHL